MISVVYPYYDNIGMIPYHLENWHSYPNEIKKNIEIIIVDDGSQKEKLIIDGKGLNLKTFYITKDIAWNVGGAKNLGVIHSSHNFLLITDMDRLISEVLMNELLTVNDLKNYYYVFPQKNTKRTKEELGSHRRGFHQGTCFVSKTNFWLAKAFDEDLSGAYGHEDGVFLSKLDALHIERKLHNKHIICYDYKKFFPYASSDPAIYGDTHKLGPLADSLRHKIPAKLDILRFPWIEGDSWSFTPQT